MDAIFQAYLAAQLRRRRSPLTIKAVRSALHTAQRQLDTEQIGADRWSLLACEQYFDSLLDAYALSTARRHLAYIRAAYQYGLRHGLCRYDPTADVRLPPLPDLEPATYSATELDAIYAAIRSEREETAFYLLALAALRLGEAANLHWRAVDLEARQLSIVGKGGKFRRVPLHPAVEQHLATVPRRLRRPDAPVIVSGRAQPLATGTLGHCIRTLVDRAGVDIDAPSHAFRRTAATTMYEHGVRTRVIERIMGWAPRRMHERHYLRIADQPMRDAILTLHEGTAFTQANEDLAVNVQPIAARPAHRWLEAERQQLEQIERALKG